MDKTNLTIAVVLVVLIIISGVQAFTLGSIKEKINNNQVSVSSSKTVSSATESSGTSSKLPSNIKDLPQMVGGC